ncbi:hypothetical protein niasHT_005722 [Heterodera trifolii]|uniref:Uncharacterized protein n=1 Tax=Heterodera trifolii TaxID=157864 RepID=A0ABD2LZ29_9BILA
MVEEELLNQSKDIATAEVTIQTLRKFFFKKFSEDDYAALMALKEKLIITTEEEEQNAKVENAKETKGQNAQEKGQNTKMGIGKKMKGQSAKVENAKEKGQNDKQKMGQNAKVENAKNELQQQLIADIEHVEKIWHRSNVKIEDPTIEHSVNSEQALVLVDANLGETTECEQLLEEFGESANRAQRNAKADKFVQKILDRINVQEMVNKLGTNDEDKALKMGNDYGEEASKKQNEALKNGNQLSPIEKKKSATGGMVDKIGKLGNNDKASKKQHQLYPIEQKTTRTTLRQLLIKSPIVKTKAGEEACKRQQQLSPVEQTKRTVDQLMGYLSQLQTVDGIQQSTGLMHISQQLFNWMAQHLGIEWHQVHAHNAMSDWRLAMRGFSALNAFLKMGIHFDSFAGKKNHKREESDKKEKQNKYKKWLRDNARFFKTAYHRLFVPTNEGPQKRRRRRKRGGDADGQKGTENGATTTTSTFGDRDGDEQGTGTAAAHRDGAVEEEADVAVVSHRRTSRGVGKWLKCFGIFLLWLVVITLLIVTVVGILILLGLTLLGCDSCGGSSSSSSSKHSSFC